MRRHRTLLALAIAVAPLPRQMPPRPDAARAASGAHAATGARPASTAAQRPADRPAGSSERPGEPAKGPDTLEQTRASVLAAFDALAADRKIVEALLAGELVLGPLANGVTFRFVYVPPGSFCFGYAEREADRVRQETKLGLLGFQSEPQVRVTVKRGYFILDQEVTAGQFEASRPGAGGRPPAAGGMAISPMADVTWVDAMRFCRWLGQEAGHEVRLPTEIEWEYAARGPWPQRFPWHEADPTTPFAAWAGQGDSGRPRPLDRAANGDASWRRAFDMAGNLSEWCLDEYSQDYHRTLIAPVEYDPAKAVVRTRPAGSNTYRTYRGGNYGDPKPLCELPLRRELNEKKSSPTIGFRPVLLVRPR